jgi:hypothetical protein
MSWALMIGKGGYARKEFNSAAPGYSRCLFAVRCTLLCELSGDGCGGPANWVAKWRGEELDSGNPIENAGIQVPQREVRRISRQTLQ